MRATPAALPPRDDDWAFEVKWDGVRALAFVDAGELRDPPGAANRRHRPLPGARRRSPTPARGPSRPILDGEVVAFDDSARPSFQLLQRRMGLATEAPIRAASIRDAGHLRRLRPALARRTLAARPSPYEERRELLAGLGLDDVHWQAPRHHVGEGEALWQVVRERNLEGIVAKRLGSPYRPGRRSRDWVKVRNRRGQELVIGGWMPGEGTRGGRVGSLLVGHWDATPEEADAPGSPAAARLRGRRGNRLHPGDARAADGACSRRSAASGVPFELGEDPRVKYAQRARDARRRPDLGRAGAGLRGRVH